MAKATAVDHQNMMEQLGITVLRPGANSRAGTPNAANYDEDKANLFTELPDALKLKNGEQVTSAEMWWKQRRPEIVEDFECEVVGRIPRDVPKVTWTVTKEVRDGVVGTLPVVGKQLVGHVDNSSYPAITVDIQMTLVTPANAKGPVPVLMMFTFGGYGKAALVTMAFEPRFAIVLVGSSGEGGAKLHRRNFGEAVENLTAAGEYHWMAGNFLKYGAAESKFGAKTPNDLPVDAHELIALCAPRPTFISYGVPEKGDSKWLDQPGSFMATVAAGRVFRLLGAKDLGVGDDYRTAKMPPVNTGLTAGQLAWRQHDGGHEDRSNMKYFIEWADGELGYRAAGK